MIQFCDLTKTFLGKEGSHTALENINLTIEDHDIFGIIGPSGAGKSTLVRCINLLERPTSGQVFIDGVEVSGFKGRKLLQLRSRIGMIFQDFNLFAQRNVLDNVVFPLSVRPKPGVNARRRALELIELVGLKGMETRYPSQLSGGQQQRVSIARALASNPDYLLCDEATSALDSLTTESILDLIKRINLEMGVTVVIITHSMNVVLAACRNLAVIDGAKIVEQGRVGQVFSAPQADITRRLLHSDGIYLSDEADTDRTLFVDAAATCDVARYRTNSLNKSSSGVDIAEGVL